MLHISMPSPGGQQIIVLPALSSTTYPSGCALLPRSMKCLILLQKREGEAARDALRQERNSMRRTQQNHMHNMEVAASEMQALQVTSQL